jgi:hypothetical protein
VPPGLRVAADLAVAVVQEYVRLAEQQAQQVGMEPVGDHRLGTAEETAAPLEVQPGVPVVRLR